MLSTATKICLAALLLALLSCSEDLLDEQTPQIITTQSLYTSFDGFQAGVNGLYAQARQERTGRTVFDNEANRLRAEQFMSGVDNCVTNVQGGEWGNLHEDWANDHNPFHQGTEANFTWLYATINAANTIVGQASERQDIDWGGGEQGDRNRNYILAEARAIRAWAYRHLTYGWGDVPLTLEESTGTSIRTDWQRSPVAEVRAQMLEDWLFAEQHIPVEPMQDGRMTKGAVQTYLAELYLTLGDAESALTWADRCVNTPEYALITERYGVSSDAPGVVYMDMFQEGNAKRSEGNTEALWVLEHEFGVTGGGRSIMRRWTVNRYDQIRVGDVNPFVFTVERGGRGIARMQPSLYWFDHFEDGDDRFSEFAVRKYHVLQDGSDPGAFGRADRLPEGFNYGDTIFLDNLIEINQETKRTPASYRRPYSRKYESLLLQNGPTEVYQFNDQVYLRLADTYLLKAEAEHLLGQNEAAAETLNLIRRRANASEIDAGDVDMEFILDERSRELYLEEHRRWTLLRTGTWLERVRRYNNNGGATASERDRLSPIPQSVIDANLTAELDQNPGF